MVSGRDVVTQRHSFDTERLDDNDIHDVRIVRDGRQVKPWFRVKIKLF